MNNPRNSFWTLLDTLKNHFNPRTPARGMGKHRAGSKYPADYRRKLKARRKAERQHRRRVMLQAKGRKHKS